MGAVAVGAVLVSVLLVIAAAFAWQSVRRSPVTDHAAYSVPDAIDFVMERLSDRARTRLTRRSVHNVLEWNLHFSQVVGPRMLGRPVVLGSGEGIEYVMQRGEETGNPVDPIDIAEIMAIETDYLLEIGAIGAPVEGDTL